MNLIGFRSDSRAVSPVVGAPLMVGVTVVLASIVGTSLLGMGAGVDDVKEPVLASAHVEYADSDDRVTVTWNANQYAEKLEVTVTVNDHASETVYLKRVGDTMRLDGDGLTMTGSRTAHDESFRVSNHDEVSVTVVAIEGGQRTVVAEHIQHV